jgi:hypothetical protein
VTCSATKDVLKGTIARASTMTNGTPSGLGTDGPAARCRVAGRRAKLLHRIVRIMRAGYWETVIVLVATVSTANARICDARFEETLYAIPELLPAQD